MLQRYSLLAARYNLKILCNNLRIFPLLLYIEAKNGREKCIFLCIYSTICTHPLDFMNNLIHGSTEENYYPRYFTLSLKDPDYINVYAIYAGQSAKNKKKLVFTRLQSIMLLVAHRISIPPANVIATLHTKLLE